MPKWGLTSDHRASAPWGLDPDLLKPSKTITEPVHKDVYLTKLERRFLDSPSMQRLRRVRQLGTTDRVYPGATHTRFAHSLGTLRSAQDLLDAVLDQRNGPHPKRDLFDEWSAEGVDVLNKRIAEATVLARLGGLLHDLCHVPFGHSVEDDLRILPSHDANTSRFEALWTGIGDDLLAQVPDQLQIALRILILSKENSPDANLSALGDYAFVADIVGNTICADLLDYLQRDHLNTGLPARFGHRFLDGFYVTPSDTRYVPRRMVIKIRRGDRLRADVITELFKFLRYRYELSERALVQHAKLAADAMVGKMLEIWFDALRDDIAHEMNDSLTAWDDIDRLLETFAADERNHIDVQTTRQLEHHLTHRSDDGLLEFLRDRAEERRAYPRFVAIGDLANGLLDRRLYKPIARSDAQYLPMAAQVHKRYETPKARRNLEAACARYAGLAHRWHVLVWIPAPEMRLKAAGVLVDDDERILPLDSTSYGGRGTEIYQSHEALWAVSVFLHEDAIAQESVVRAWLARELRIGWAEDSPVTGGGALVRLAAQRVAHRRNLTRDQEESLAVDPAATGGQETFVALENAIDAIATAKFVPPASARRPARAKDAGQDDLDLK